MEPVVKPWYFSKTILVNVIMGIAMILAQFKPEVAAWITSNLGEAGTAWAFINVVLRIITKDKVSIS